MISKKLLKEFSVLPKNQKQDLLFDKVSNGSLTKEEFIHLLYDYAEHHPVYPPTTGDCW